MAACELAIVGARVRTLDEGRAVATAVAIRDGAIVAVGADDEIRELCDARTELLDAAGAAVVPGLTDAHMHPFTEDAQGAYLNEAKSLDAVRAALATEAARAREGWVRGYGLRYDAFAGSPICGSLFAEACGGRPALVIFSDFHTAVATSAALAAAGVDGPRRFDDNSAVVCDADGPTGELQENAIALVEAAIPALSENARLDLIAAQLARMNATGLTGCHAMDGTPATLERCRILEEQGRLTLRQVVVPFTIPPDMPEEEYAALEALREQGGRLWRAGAAKFFIDGVVESGTAWLDGANALGQPSEPFWPEPARYRSAVARFDRAGFQCVTHAIGERGIREALDAYRAAAGANGPRDRRHRIEHIETAPDRDIDRFGPEDVVASQQPIHLQWTQADGADPWSRALGPERAARAFRSRDLRASGAVLALGSDWPVAHFDPRLGMAWARLRRKPGHPEQAPIGADQQLSAGEALAGYTTEAARAVGEEHVSGAVRPGFRGDLTILAEDPVDCEADALPEISIRATIVDGRIVYRADG